MINLNARWLVVGLFSVALLSVQAWAGPEQWQNHMDAAVEAFVDGDYAEAAQRFEAAVNEAESFDADDPRLAESLNGLGVVYRTVRRFTEAEPLLRRALAIRERVKVPAQLDLIQSLNNLVGLYLDQGRTADAEPLLKRSQDLEPGQRRQSRS